MLNFWVFSPFVGEKYFKVDLSGKWRMITLTPSVGIVHMWVR
jgi:hypothetical protein